MRRSYAGTTLGDTRDEHRGVPLSANGVAGVEPHEYILERKFAAHKSPALDNIHLEQLDRGNTGIPANR